MKTHSHAFQQVDSRFTNITPIGRYLLPRKRGMIASAQRRCGRRNGAHSPRQGADRSPMCPHNRISAGRRKRPPCALTSGTSPFGGGPGAFLPLGHRVGPPPFLFDARGGSGMRLPAPFRIETAFGYAKTRRGGRGVTSRPGGRATLRVPPLRQPRPTAARGARPAEKRGPP